MSEEMCMKAKKLAEQEARQKKDAQCGITRALPEVGPVTWWCDEHFPHLDEIKRLRGLPDRGRWRPRPDRA